MINNVICRVLMSGNDLYIYIFMAMQDPAWPGLSFFYTAATKGSDFLIINILCNLKDKSKNNILALAFLSV